MKGIEPFESRGPNQSLGLSPSLSERVSMSIGETSVLQHDTLTLGHCCQVHAEGYWLTHRLYGGKSRPQPMK